jgi:hypothetical protein
MRFDGFVVKRGLTVSAVNRFAGFFVEVGVPSGWEPFDSVVGVRVWVCRDDPCIEKFCANAVLTMHRVEAALDPADVFTMLADQQLQSAPECHEVRRELCPAGEFGGVQGLLAMQITHELGAIDSVSQSRIITAGQETMIAQFTVTARHDSPVNGAHIRLTVRPGAAASPASAGHCRAPATATREGC